MPVDVKTAQIMIFIYRALDDGWVVRKLGTDKYEFKKPYEDITEEVTSDDFCTNFLRKFSSVDSFFSFLHSTREDDETSQS